MPEVTDERQVALVTDDPRADVAIVFHTLDDGELWKNEMGDWDLARRNDAVHATDQSNEADRWRDPPLVGSVIVAAPSPVVTGAALEGETDKERQSTAPHEASAWPAA